MNKHQDRPNLAKMTLGTKIRSLRQSTGMTQAVLADQLGVTDKAVSKWERDASYPDVSLFPHLADLLGVTIDDLLRGDIDEENPSRLIQIFELSHDIRTPLHMILGCADMAEFYPDDNVRLHRYLENIRISGEYLLEKIDEIMKIVEFDPDLSCSGPGRDSAQDTAFASEPEDPVIRRSRRLIEIVQQFDFRGKRILLAEDMELNREIAYELIRRTGADIEFAEDGAICLAKVRDADPGTYDLILMDLRMPNMDGMEAAKEIRALNDPAKSDIPIIAMTANVFDQERNKALAVGMNDFVGKPIDIELLYQVMQEQMK